MKLNKTITTDLISDVKKILETAQQKAYAAVNFAMVEGYWLTGKRIIEEEQLGEKRAAYGKKIIENLSLALSGEFKKNIQKEV